MEQRVPIMILEPKIAWEYGFVIVYCIPYSQLPIRFSYFSV